MSNDTLAPPPVNFEREIVEVEGKFYEIVYDKRTQTLYAPREIQQQTHSTIPRPTLATLVILGAFLWFFIIRWLWRLIF